MDPKGEELAAMIAEIRQRVRARHPNGTVLGDVQIPDLLPLVHARDAAEAKVASIGSVNPRPAGLVNSVAQAIKRMVARALNWHVREQVEFNRALMGVVQATIEALNESNRAVASLSARMGSVAEAAQQMSDMRAHWSHWRLDWEKKLASNEFTYLKGVADLQGAFQHRVTLLEANFREQVKAQHANFEAAAARANREIQEKVAEDLSYEINQLQERFWADMERIRTEYETIIHAELRVMRQRSSLGQPAVHVTPGASAAFEGVDWLKFAEKFRGQEDAIKQRQHIYADRFRACASVLDIGCGRGEMLEVLRDAGVDARGIDMSEECIALCSGKGLNAERADLFEYLSALPDSSLGGAVCSQVVEHLPPERLPEMIRMLHAKLRAGALLAIETPNPECLAIFASHFYLDPTHRHPIPPALMSFYLEEGGFGRIEVERLSPAVESMPSLAELPVAFQKEFFGALDYAVFARKLG